MAKKKSISSWKQKREYSILAPKNFDSQLVGTTVSSDPKNLIGNTIRVSMRELSDDRGKQHMNLVFEISGVEGETAHTNFKQFDVAPGYLRSKVRKGMTKINYVQDFSFDGMRARVKIMVVAGKHTTVAQKRQIARRMTDVLSKHTKGGVDQFVQFVLFGKLGTEVYRAIQGICQVHRVEVYQIRAL